MSYILDLFNELLILYLNSLKFIITEILNKGRNDHNLEQIFF